MSDLVEFIEARIGEDEVNAKNKWRRPHWAHCNTQGDQSSLGDDCDCGLPARVLAECAAKRRIVEQLAPIAEETWDVDLGRVLKLLALPYADHDDYDERWRP